jgi:hypothetical protein
MDTMTISEAEKIIDIVSAALQDTSHRHHPISALRGYNIYEICIALKLRIANEFLHLAYRDDFDERFAEGLRLYSSTPWLIMRFVPDDQADDPFAEFPLMDSATMTFKDERLAQVEMASSFGDYCKSVGLKDPNYWQKIYARIGLEYTSRSPQGNDPVTVGSDEENHDQKVVAAEPLGRDWKIGIIGVSVLTIAMLAYVLFGAPAYSFYSMLKWTVGIASVLGAWALYTESKRYLPISVCLALVGGVHVFARMRKSQWAYSTGSRLFPYL